MLDVRQRLAGHLYSTAIDLDPEASVALRLGHSSGLTWSLDDSALTISVGGAASQSFPLTGTVNQLATALTASGITVTDLNSETASAPSDALLRGSGDTTSSSRNSLLIFGSNLWTLLDAYGVEVRSAALNVEEAIRQLYLDLAEGEILDFWGEFFAVPRKDSEGDSAYYARLIGEVLRPKNTRFAIQNAILAETGLRVSIREPWREIFALDFSALSDADHFQDGSFFTWNVFQPIYHSSLSVEERARILEIIERNRPAGCLIVGEFAQPPIGYAQASLAWAHSSLLTLRYDMGWLHFQSNTLSSSLALSDGLVDIGSAFKWINLGNLVLTFGSEPLSLMQPLYWTGGWNSRRWLQGSISSVVTQNSV